MASQDHDPEKAPDAARAVADADAALRSNGGSSSSSATVTPEHNGVGGAQNNGAAPATEAANAKEQQGPAAHDDDAPEESRTRLQTILIMFALCSALFLAALDVTIVATAVPTIVAEFGSASGTVRLVTNQKPSVQIWLHKRLTWVSEFRLHMDWLSLHAGKCRDGAIMG